jgi:nucleosome assembly protein 1-like 1
MNIRP